MILPQNLQYLILGLCNILSVSDILFLVSSFNVRCLLVKETAHDLQQNLPDPNNPLCYFPQFSQTI